MNIELNEKENVLVWEIISSGQKKPHQDSITRVRIVSNKDSQFVKKFCTETLIPCQHEGGGSFSGACSFPYGLESFFAFTELETREDGLKQYQYMVCFPYTG